eukprot:COSAG01_NODE_2_length_63927_cov_1357.611941_33_plen_236_part_00
MGISFSQRNTLVILFFFPIAALLLYGSDLSKSVLYQYGFDAKVRIKDGAYQGASLAMLKRQGGMAIGLTADYLSYVLGHQGKFYLLDIQGGVKPAPLLTQVGFAYLTKFSFDEALKIEDPLSYSGFELYLMNNLGDSHLYALRLKAYFSSLDLSFVSDAHRQSSAASFGHFDHISGTVLGFSVPASFDSPFGERLFFYFISDDQQVAGRVLDFSLIEGMLSVDLKKQFVLEWPQL